MRFLVALLAALSAMFVVPLAAQSPAEAEPLPPEVVKLLDSLMPVGGKVEISEAQTTLDFGE